jgi:SAM-dependent methyltransferase
MLPRLLSLPELRQVDVDGQARIDLHASILARKPMLREVFTECHRLFMELDRTHFGAVEGLRVELGAGVAPVRDTYPEVLATDVVPAPMLDRVLDAQAMDFSDGSVRAFYGQNCFHHFPEPDAFFREVMRVAAPGGGAILIEPYHGPVASILYKRLFASEDFDKRMPGWTSNASGPMAGANQALSYIVFERDAALFAERFPSLEIVERRPLTNYIRYLTSGGLNFRQLAPTLATPLLKGVEAALAPAARWLALHHVIVLRRRAADWKKGPDQART